MGGYLAHTEYKDSGVEWLGRIPTTWKIMPIKFALSIPITDGPHETPELQDEGIPFISAEAIKNDRIDFSKKRGYISIEEHKRFSKKYKPQYGDVYMVKSEATTGNVARVETEEDFNIWSPLAVLRPAKDISTTNFLFYAMKSKPFFYSVELSWSFGTQQNIGMGVISNIEIALPPVEEQRSIARFLDYKTAQIDALITKKETLLKKLAEKRTALISQAVTKGCDRTVPMKDSRVEWLGEIPAHWNASRLKYVSHLIIDGTHVTPTYLNEGIPFLRVTDIVQADTKEINLDNVKFISEEEHKILSRRSKPEKGDLLYSKNGTIGVVRVVNWDFEFSIFVSLCLIKINKEKLKPEFLAYSLLGKSTENQISIGAKSNTVTNLHLDKIKEFWVCLPSLEEQERTVLWLDEITKEINASVQTVRTAIDKLKEYRAALITNAVTGKIDIRDVILELKPVEAA